MKKAVIVHGWGGHPNIYWLPWLKTKLESNGFSVTVPQMPNTDNPNKKEWIDTLTETVGTPNENVYLVAHSLGCPTILRYLESLKEGEKIGGVVLVAGFSEKIGYVEPDSFLQTPINFEKVKSHCAKFVTMNSDNDSYIPYKLAEILRDNLNSEFIFMKGAGHLNAEAGFIELPEALSAVLKISS